MLTIDEQLHAAVRCGEVELCKQLLLSGANVNAVSVDGRTPLHLAAEAGNRKLCRTLLDLGADPKLGDAYGYTPLHLAASRKDGDSICHLLLDYDADIEAITLNGDTPLQVAEALGPTAAGNVLRERGAKDCGPGSGHRPLMVPAAAKPADSLQPREIVEVLRLSKDKPELFHFALCSAAEMGQTEMCEELLSLDGYSENKEAITHALVRAASENHHQSCETLIRYGADVNVEVTRNPTAHGRSERAFTHDSSYVRDEVVCSSLLWNAVIDGNTETTLVLLKHGADPFVGPTPKCSPYDELMRINRPNFVAFGDAKNDYTLCSISRDECLRDGSTSKEAVADWCSPRSGAKAFRGSEEELEALNRQLLSAVERGNCAECLVALNAGAYLQDTELKLACKKGDIKLLRTLLTYNIEANRQYVSLRTELLEIAVEQANENMCRFLLHLDLGMWLWPETVPALFLKTQGLMLLLLEHFDVEARDEKGRTVLHLAAMNGLKDHVLNLVCVDMGSDEDCDPRDLRHTANASVFDNTGKTPLELALENGNEACILMLIVRSGYFSLDTKYRVKLLEVAGMDISEYVGSPSTSWGIGTWPEAILAKVNLWFDSLSGQELSRIISIIWKIVRAGSSTFHWYAALDENRFSRLPNVAPLPRGQATNTPKTQRESTRVS